MITVDDFKKWLDVYGRASKENDPQASAELFAQDAEYYETPFANPMVGREAIYRYWEAGAQTLTDKEFSYEVLAVKGNTGIGRWQGTFVNATSGSRVALDCVFLVEFDGHKECSVFREWWHSQVNDSFRRGLE
jgi:hypothetical protein